MKKLNFYQVGNGLNTSGHFHFVASTDQLRNY